MNFESNQKYTGHLVSIIKSIINSIPEESRGKYIKVFIENLGEYFSELPEERIPFRSAKHPGSLSTFVKETFDHMNNKIFVKTVLSHLEKTYAQFLA